MVRTLLKGAAIVLLPMGAQAAVGASCTFTKVCKSDRGCSDTEYSITVDTEADPVTIETEYGTLETTAVASGAYVAKHEKLILLLTFGEQGSLLSVHSTGSQDFFVSFSGDCEQVWN
ncbi:hypothetical protein [uncultured Tateyamaria sp.]|uniref:hypothetical protein n=1 Tax=uncultured Tateyamaria sp. TaxID=455651 RepID=UPI00261152C0|nr:hypothetical protein [uncultured Tateyamaria sp.]